MDARCPECEKVAILNDEVSKVKCPHCNFEADYDTYLEIMKGIFTVHSGYDRYQIS